jgi:hypothetical protein
MPIEMDETCEGFGRPLVLIVATNGLELQLLLPPVDARAVHSCLPWKPTPCRCGATHATSEPFDLVVFVGRPDLTLKTDPGGTTVYVVPAKTDLSLLQHPVIVAYDDQGFGPWAAAVLFNLVCGISITGLLGYDFGDLRAFFSSGKRFRALFARGDQSVDQLALEIAKLDKHTSSAACHVGIAGPLSMTLGEVNSACEAILVTNGKDDESKSFIFWSIIVPEDLAQVSVVFVEPVLSR